MTKPVKITIAEVATLMHKNPLFVREGMRRGVLPIGTAMQMEGSTRWNFYISPPLLAEYLGTDIPGLMDMLEQIREEKAG